MAMSNLYSKISTKPMKRVQDNVAVKQTNTWMNAESPSNTSESPPSVSPLSSSIVLQREGTTVSQPLSAPASPLSSLSPVTQLTSPGDCTQDPNWQATKPTVRERNAAMFNNHLMADIIFIVGSPGHTQTIPAHKYVLATGSSVFYAMFYGGLPENKRDIEVPDVEPAAFLALLSSPNAYPRPTLFGYEVGLENDEMRTRIVPKRQTNYPTAAETHGSSDTSKYSDGQSYPTRASGYQSGLGYPDNNGYPRSGSSKASDDSTNQPRSGYSSNDSASYPSRRSSDSFSRFSGYPTRESAGYPTSGSSNYPPGGSLGYSTSRLPGYLSNGYSSSQSSDYPSSGSSGSLSEFSYHNSKDSSDYPTGSGYPNRNGGSSNNSRNPYGEETVRRTGVNAVNTGYPSYPQGNPSYRGNYPARNTGYLDNNQHPLYSNQGYSNGYPQNYPQGGYSEGYYRSQNYMTTTKRPGFREQLTNFARNVAEKVLTQTILDRVTGKHQ